MIIEKAPMLTDVQWAYEEGQGNAAIYRAREVAGINAPFLVVGGAAVSLEYLLDAPRAIRERVAFRDRASFCEYVKIFSAPAETWTAVFADTGTCQVVAILDYHAPTAPARGQHRAELSYRHSDQWCAWTKPGVYTQARFADFLGDHGDDIVPDGSAGISLQEMVRSLEITSNKKWASAVRGGGVVTLTQEVEQQVKGPSRVEIPVRLKLSIPVFEDGPRRDIGARISYTIKDGAVTFGVALVRAAEIERTLFRAEVATIAAALALPVLYGMPQ